MHRLAFALALFACGPKKSDTTAKGPPPIPKRVAISWGQEQHDGQTEVFLQMTDETGKQVSQSVGSYPGACTVKEPAPDMNAQLAIACLSGDKNTELHGVIQRDEVIILKMVLDGGAKPDPMARQEVTRVKAPGGASILVGT